MIKYILIVLMLALTGCGKPMTYEQVAEAEKYCTDKGLFAQRYTYPLSGTSSEVNYVRCKDKQGNTFPVPTKK